MHWFKFVDQHAPKERQLQTIGLLWHDGVIPLPLMLSVCSE
jgi:hypothetical protein